MIQANMLPHIHPSWQTKLTAECNKPYFANLSSVVQTAYTQGEVYPPIELVFTAFSLCPFSSVKVVILGQDPYHGHGQAHGLSFSVPEGITPPPSLKNIYKELASDLGVLPKTSGNLESWAKQGVLLLNATLTVLPGQPGSHQDLGWENFTDAVIRTISSEKEHVVFILWGKYAQAKKTLIDTSKHLIIESPHPSPFSARTGFFGSRPFSRTNEYLKEHGHLPIDW
jgi:uracil-DNA glycosylase